MNQRVLQVLVVTLLLVNVLSEDVFPPTLPEFLYANLTRAPRRYNVNTPYRVLELVNIPDVIQSTGYTCGPVAMQSVLHYFSLEVRESEVMAAAGTIPNKGTGPVMLQNGFNKLVTQRGLQGKLQFIRKENMTLDELVNLVDNGQPVIALLQNFKPPSDPTPYIDYNDRGHYMVIIGQDAEYFYLQDPKLLNNLMYIRKEEFVDRWHDQLSSEGRLAVHVGIVIRNKDGSKPPAKQKVHYLLD